jgi:uncharacterized phage protein (TIGR02218 family)
MTYASEILENEQEAMPEFYEIRSGGTTWYYTSYITGLIFRGVAHEPASIRRSGFSQDVQFGKVEVNLTAPVTDIFAQYIANLPIEPAKITIYRAIKSDLTDYINLFSGTIKGVTIKDKIASAKCEARSSLLSARLPAIIYQSFCNHDVFDSGCGLSELTWRVIGTVIDITGYTITATAFGTKPNGYFTGGRVQHGDDFRLITDHTTTVLNLQLPFDARLELGEDVIALPGCDGNPSTCEDKFDNLIKFLGMPYIPSHNPAIWGFR